MDDTQDDAITDLLQLSVMFWEIDTDTAILCALLAGDLSDEGEA